MIKATMWTISAGALVLFWAFAAKSCSDCVKEGGTPVRGFGPMPACVDKP